MYWLLALVLDANIRDGTWWPAFILCQSWTTNEKRSGWRIIAQKDGVPTSNLPKVLVTEITGHEDMIQFMSSYQKTDPKTKKHYHPKGALCWFSCNQYGDPMGEVVFIKRVPEWRWIFDFSNRGFQQLKRTREKEPELKELFNASDKEEPMPYSDIKHKLHQNSKRKDRLQRRKENGSSKENK